MSAAAYSRKILLLFFVFISIASQSQICSKTQLPANLQNGLVAYYPFCGNANDASGNGLNGTLNGQVLVQDRFNASKIFCT
jgi:hypothetical protein